MVIGIALAALSGCSGSQSPYSTPLSAPASAPVLATATNKASTATDIRFTEVFPLLNQRVKTAVVPDADKGRINPRPLKLPGSAYLSDIDDVLRVESLINDVTFKDFFVQSSINLGKVEISVDPVAADGIAVTPRLVTSWFQSGMSTKKFKKGGALTNELLLSNDLQSPQDGVWRKKAKGGWIYHPPDIQLDDVLTTRLAANAPKRLLLRFEISDSVRAGIYRTQMRIRQHGQNGEVLSTLPVEIHVGDVKLTDSVDSRYTLALFTALKFNQTQERPRAYVNSMRLAGSRSERETALRNYLADIRQHGFNGITIRDWSDPGLSTTLDIAKGLGYRDVILHATTPVKKSIATSTFPIVNQTIIEKYRSRGLEPMFYGFDEVGGNRDLPRQLAINREIHRLGGKSVNAVFWDDMPNVIATVATDASRCFDIIAHSIGSHGHIDMLQELPFKKNESVCADGETQHVVYWHPHVESPNVNRLLMGFWLWASGFDGVIPHGHYFPSHIEKVLTPEDRRRGVSTAALPYDDWSFWLPKDTLRHHNAVYPSTTGPIGTLQWEGVLSGYTDLKYVVTLEGQLALDSTSPAMRAQIRSLFDEIRTEVLQVRSGTMDDTKSRRFERGPVRWRSEIRRLLQEIAGDSTG